MPNNEISLDDDDTSSLIRGSSVRTWSRSKWDRWNERLGKRVVLVPILVGIPLLLVGILVMVFLQKTNPSGRSYIIDTDVGFDDMLAISTLLSAHIHITGITTVRGLTRPNIGATNLLRILDKVDGGTAVPVYAGEEPLPGGENFPSFWQEPAESLEGITGVPATASRAVPELGAVNWLLQTLGQAPEKKTTIICLGPLSNIARALRVAGPQFPFKAIQRLVIGAGALDVQRPDMPGNETAEWNVRVDPIAMKETLAAFTAAGVDVKILPLDVTTLSELQGPERAERCFSFEEAPTRSFTGMLAKQASLAMCQWNLTVLYDYVTAVYSLDLNPKYIPRTFENVGVSVVTTGADFGRLIRSNDSMKVDIAAKDIDSVREVVRLQLWQVLDRTITS